VITALLIVVRAAHITASILIAGSFTFDVVALGSRRRIPSEDSRVADRVLVRLAVWSLIAAALSGVLWFWLEVLNMTGLPLSGVFSISAWETVLLNTKFGHLWFFRIGVGVALAFGISAYAQSEARRRSLSLALWFLSLLFLVSLAWICHAAAARTQPLGVVSDALHLCAAGGWIGGLISLAIFLTRAALLPRLDKRLALILERFSTLSLCCVGILVASGICNSWLLVGSVHALFMTTYGWLLLFKLTLFGILISFGARNRLLVKTKLRNLPEVSDLLPQLRRNVICEAGLGVAVLAIVACLGVTPPAISMMHTMR
jgi:putative copper resistance protein D